MLKSINTLKLDDAVLRNTCEPADFDKPKKNLDLAHTLIKTMIKEHGMGLAANQCGVNVRLFVMRVDDRYFHCFNPEILEYSEEQVSLTEGCLSFPNQFCDITRPKRVKVRYYSAQGTETVEWLGGWTARCFQHELDHLNGLTMFDK